MNAPLLIALSCLLPSMAMAQHVHLNVGAARPEAGTPLAFINAASLDIQSAWFLPMPLQSSGLHQGLYRGSSLTFTVLPASPDYGGPAPFHPAPGARIVAEIVSLQGPAGGEIGFWDSDGIAEADSVTHRIPVGTTQGSWRFTLSEGDGSDASDPYGHIHGRHFTTTVPGLYVLGLRAIDVSNSAPGGSPWHAPSPVIKVFLQAGSTLEFLPNPGGDPSIRFAAEKGRVYHLLFSSGIESTPWRVVVGPHAGNGTVQTNLVQGPLHATGFYRLLIQ